MIHAIGFARADNIRPYKGMKLRMELHRRKPIRLRGYDYSLDGAYFVTVCVNSRAALLWRPAKTNASLPQDDAALQTDKGFPKYDIHPSRPLPLSEYGRTTETSIKNIRGCYHNVDIDKYCIMPDHIHLIVFILPEETGRMISAPSKTLSTVIGQMKRWVSKQVGFPIWQKSFYDHIIRDQDSYSEVWKYIDENPLKYQM